MNEGKVQPEEIVTFWRDIGPKGWFEKNPKLDAEIRQRFLSVHEAAAEGRLAAWEQSPQGALALLILLDQFPRNMFRGDKRAFATDELARAVASRAILNGFDGAVSGMRTFFYLPFEHSEDMADQERCVALYKAAGDADGLKWAELHADIIRKFSRFPHRNDALGRTSTPEEQVFLDGGGFSG